MTSQEIRNAPEEELLVSLVLLCETRTFDTGDTHAVHNVVRQPKWDPLWYGEEFTLHEQIPSRSRAVLPLRHHDPPFQRGN